MLWVIFPGVLYVALYKEAFPYSVEFQAFPLIGITLFSFFYRPLFSLKWYFFALALYMACAFIIKPYIQATDFWAGVFYTEGSTKQFHIFSSQLLRLSEALMLLLILLGAGYRRHDLFLSMGNLKAPAEPVRWMDIKENENWRDIFFTITPIISLVSIVPLYFMIKPQFQDLLSLGGQVPIIIFNASANAFYEEFISRAALLCILVPVIGKRSALAITVVFFGLGHYAGGFPNGILGVFMAGVLAYILGKSMLETRGMLYAWAIHMVLDVIVFSFIAMR